MSDPQQPGEGAQAPKDPTATPSSTPDQGQTAPPPAPYQRPAGDSPFAAPVPPQAGSEADDPAPGAYTPPSYQPGQPGGSAPVPSSVPQPPAGPGAEATGYGAYSAPGQGATAYASGYPGSAQVGGPGQTGGPGYPGSAQVGGPGYPGQPGGYPAQPAGPGGSGQGGNGLAIASIVLGGVGLVLSLFGVVGLVIALVGLALGIVALVRKMGKRLLSIIGTALSGVAVLASIISIIVGLLILDSFEEEFGSSGPAATAPAAPAPTAEAPAEEQDEDEAGGATSTENASFGETVTYQDGLAITVSAPETFTPGENAYGADQAAAVVFTITLENGTGSNFDPVLARASVSSGGVEGAKIYDYDDPTLEDPRTTIPDGQSVTWRTAFSVADPESLVVQMSPGPFEYEDVVYQN